MRRDDPRIIASRALTLTRQALMTVRRARLRLERAKVRDQRLVESLLVLELVLERIALRLETIIVSNMLSPGLVVLPYELLREASTMGIPPALASILGDLEVALSGLYEYSYANVGMTDNIKSNIEYVRSEAKKIIEEARIEAKKRIGGESTEDLAQ